MKAEFGFHDPADSGFRRGGGKVPVTRQPAQHRASGVSDGASCNRDDLRDLGGGDRAEATVGQHTAFLTPDPGFGLNGAGQAPIFRENTRLEAVLGPIRSYRPMALRGLTFELDQPNESRPAALADFREGCRLFDFCGRKDRRNGDQARRASCLTENGGGKPHDETYPIGSGCDAGIECRYG